MKPRGPNDGFEHTAVAYQTWIASRPEVVRQNAIEFPMGSVITLEDGDYYVIGWTETSSRETAALILSKIWIGDDYERAIATRIKLHAQHVRDGNVPIRRYEGDKG
jgi:hypothetical protein